MSHLSGCHSVWCLGYRNGVGSGQRWSSNNGSGSTAAVTKLLQYYNNDYCFVFGSWWILVISLSFSRRSSNSSANHCCYCCCSSSQPWLLLLLLPMFIASILARSQHDPLVTSSNLPLVPCAELKGWSVAETLVSSVFATAKHYHGSRISRGWPDPLSRFSTP